MKKFETVHETKEPEKLEKEKTTISSEESKKNFDTLTEDMDETLRAFSQSKSEFETGKNVNSVNDERKINIAAPEFAQKICLRLANFVFTGFNFYILNMFSKTKIEFSELKLNDEDLKEFEIYGETVANAVLKYLPDWALMLLHVEFVFIEKFDNAVKNKKLNLVEDEKSKK